MISVPVCAISEDGSGTLVWKMIAELPAPEGQSAHKGLAGAFCGRHQGTVIVAGGNHFPDAPVYQGGEKVYYDAIYVMQKGQDESYGITSCTVRLPRPLGYGVSISTDEGVMCIGGCDAEQCYADVFLLKWNLESANVHIEILPSLPVPLAYMSGALVGNTIYLAGGAESIESVSATTNFFALNLSEIKSGWQKLKSWPGPARMLAAAAGQHDGTTMCFYLFSGRDVRPGQAAMMLNDAYAYNPLTKTWKRLADVTLNQNPRCVMGGTATASGGNHILVFGGDDGVLFSRMGELARQIQTAEPASLASLKEQYERSFTVHPGFNGHVLSYHTITNTWVNLGPVPGGGTVTTTVVPLEGGYVLPCGENHPGSRSANLWRMEFQSQRSFGWVNYAVLVVYLAAVVGVGFLFTSHKNTNDFFRGGQRIPAWAAGLSIFATMLSSITYMAIPAKAYATDWSYYANQISAFAITPLIIYFYLPFYRRLDVTSAYEYLERRFNLAVRLYGSLMFILFQLGRMAIVLYLPAIALATVSSLDVYLCIVVMGVLCILYTMIGGMEAVIWADVIQSIVLLAGAIVTILLIFCRYDGSLADGINIARLEGKFFSQATWSWDTASATLSVIIIGGIFSNLSSYTAGQDIVQRYMTTKDLRQAARSVWTNAFVCVGAAILFFFVGTSLYLFYKSHPALLDPTLPTDAIFPLFMVRELPVGIAGIVIAGVFAAAQSTLSGSLNSVATAWVTDFHRRFRPEASELSRLRLAKWLTLIMGAGAIAVALVMASANIASLWDSFLKILGLTGGGLAALFALGIFTRRTNGVGAFLGAIVSAIVLYWIQEQKHIVINFFLFAAIGFWICAAVGYLASLLIPARAKSLEGLTLFTCRKDQE